MPFLWGFPTRHEKYLAMLCSVKNKYLKSYGMGINWDEEKNVQVEIIPNINLGLIVKSILYQISGISKLNMKNI